MTQGSENGYKGICGHSWGNHRAVSHTLYRPVDYKPQPCGSVVEKPTEPSKENLIPTI